MKVSDLSGNRYDSKNLEKSFNSWRETIKRSIKQNIKSIKPTVNKESVDISKNFFGKYLYDFMFDSNPNTNKKVSDDDKMCA